MLKYRSLRLKHRFDVMDNTCNLSTWETKAEVASLEYMMLCFKEKQQGELKRKRREIKKKKKTLIDVTPFPAKFSPLSFPSFSFKSDDCNSLVSLHLRFVLGLCK